MLQLPSWAVDGPPACGLLSFSSFAFVQKQVLCETLNCLLDTQCPVWILYLLELFLLIFKLMSAFPVTFRGRWQVASLLFLPAPVLPYDASVCRFIRLRHSQRHLLPNELNLKWSIDERRAFFLYARRHSLMALIYTVCGNL